MGLVISHPGAHLPRDSAAEPGEREQNQLYAVEARQVAHDP